MPIFIAKLTAGLWIMLPALNTVSSRPSDARPVECASHIALQLRLGLPSGQEENLGERDELGLFCAVFTGICLCSWVKYIDV